MDQTTMMMISNILVALLSAGGFWALLEKIPNARRKRRDENIKNLLVQINKLDSQANSNKNDIHELSESIKAILNGMNTMYENQKECAIKITNSEELSRAVSRDRLNYLANLYIKQGYIPQEGIIPFKLLGKAYVESGGNSETKTKFEHCINELPVRRESDMK